MDYVEEKEGINKKGLILLTLVSMKILIYILATNIEYDRPWIFLVTFSVFSLIVVSLEISNFKHKKTYILGFYVVFSLIIFADVLHYKYFKSLASVALLKQVDQVGAITDSIAMLLSLENLALLIDIPILIYLKRKNENDSEILIENKELGKKLILTLLLVLILIFSYFLLGEKFVSLKNQEFFIYHISDIKNSFTDDSGLDENFLTELKRIKTERSKEGDKHFGIGKDRNLILIQVESLQQFVIGMEYKGQEITPNLNKLINNGETLYFDNYFQMLGRGNTSDAEFVTNNSLYPSMEDYTYLQYEDNTFYGLPKILKDQGYNTWAFHGYKKEFWNREKAYIGQGFEEFMSEEDFDFEEEIGFGIRDEDFLEQTLDYLVELKEEDNPFYSFIVTLTSHTPYKMEDKYKLLDIEEEENIVYDYLQSIRYVDECLGEFIEGLKEEGLYDNSIIALYGDHYGVNNHDETVHEPMKKILGENYYFDHVMNIPLIINIPGVEIGETVSKIGSQIDFLPTILNIMGIENEKGFTFGRDILNYEGYHYVPVQTIMRKGSFIDEDYVFFFSGDGIFEHSTAVDRKTRKKVDIDKFRETYEESIEEINLGNAILKNDLIKDIVENDGDITKISLETKEIELPKVIYNYDSRVEWNLSRQLEETKILKIDLDKEEVDKWDIISALKKNRDSYLLLSSEEDVRDPEKSKFAEIVKESTPELLEQCIVEVKDFNDYFFIHRDGMRNGIINVVENQYTDEEVLDAIFMNDYLGVILPENKGSSKLARELKKKDIKVYIESNNKYIEK